MDKELEPKAIFDRLRQDHSEEFTGSYWAVKRLCRRLYRERGVIPESIPLRVETEPGEVAQVDFGQIGRLYDPRQNGRTAPRPRRAATTPTLSHIRTGVRQVQAPD